MKFLGARLESWILLIIASLILILSTANPHIKCIHHIINGINQYYCPEGA